MKKGFHQVLLVAVVGVLVGSSAFAAQVAARANVQVAATGSIERVDKPYVPAPLAEVNREEGVVAAGEQEPAAPVPKAALEDKPRVEEKNKVDAVLAHEPDRPAATQAVEIKPAPVPEEKKRPAQPYRLGETREYSVLTKVTVKNTGAETANDVRLEIPLLTSSSPYQAQLGESFSLEPSEIKILQGARAGIFALGSLEPGEERVLELRYRVRTAKIEFFSDYLPAGNGEKPILYLATSKNIESDDPRIVGLAAEITRGAASDWEKAMVITRWVASSIRYDAQAANRNGGALLALQTGRGVCEDYAALAAALARAAGIPARVAYGYTDNGSNWPATGPFALRGYRHAWVEFYLEGHGWVPAEPTRSTGGRLYFGTLPHNRYIVQNYNDVSLRGSFRGGKLSVSWTDSLE